VAGLILGLTTVKADGVTCGTALGGKDRAQVLMQDLRDITAGGDGHGGQACDDALGSRRGWTWGLGLPGLVLLGVVGVRRYTASVDREWERERART